MNSYLVVRRYRRFVTHLTICMIVCISLVLGRDGYYVWAGTQTFQGQRSISKSCVTLRGDHRFKRYVDLVRAVHNMPVTEVCDINTVSIRRVDSDYVVHIV